MRAIKDFYDIVTDVWDRVKSEKQKKKRHLSDYLDAISELLDKIAEKLKKKEIPSGEASEFAVLLLDANKIAVPLKKE